MLVDLPAILAAKIVDVAGALIPITLGMAAAYAALALFSSQACNPGKHAGGATAGSPPTRCYWLIIPFVAPYIRIGLMLAIAVIPMRFVTADQLGRLHHPWTRPDQRVAPGGAGCALSARVGLPAVLDPPLCSTACSCGRITPSITRPSTSTGRRPTAFIRSISASVRSSSTSLMLYAGISPIVLMALAPWQTISATFVHANLNWTLGPLKYVIATPVFHRWHHSRARRGRREEFRADFLAVGRDVRHVLHAGRTAAAGLWRRRCAVSAGLFRAA